MSESLFSTEQIQKQVAPLKSSEVYFSIDIKFVGVITKKSTLKMNWEMLHTAVHLWGHGSVNSQAWPTYVLLSVTI